MSIDNVLNSINSLIIHNKSYDEIYNVLLNSNIQWSNSVEKKLQRPLRRFRCDSFENVLTYLIVYIYLKGDEAVDFTRKRGIFAFYYEWDDTEKIIRWLDHNSGRLNISEKNRKYLSHKYDVRWMADYYVSCDREIDKFFKDHVEKKISRNLNGNILESNIVVELMVLLELLFRIPGDIFTMNKSAAIECLREVDYDHPEYYSRESIGEAVSYLISKYCENFQIEENKILWIDAEEFTSGTGLAELLLIALKRNEIVEWEIGIDYFGYDIKCVNGAHYRIVDAANVEKTIQLGYIKTDIQEQARNCSYFKSPDDVLYLYSIAKDLEEISDCLFEIADKNTFMERYRMNLYEPLIEYLTPADFDKPQFFMEEQVQIANASNEMFLSVDNLLKYRVTEHCNIKDIILFKRLFTLIAYMYQAFFEKHNDDPKKTVKSAVPVFKKEALLLLSARLVGDKEKALDLIDFFTWDKNGKLDLQSTPILKLAGNQYYLMPYVLAASNLIRNGIVRGRQLNFQITNPNGKDEPLEVYAEKLFEFRKDIFHHTRGRSFNYKGQKGEVDLIVWTKEHLYLIECKNPILPISPFELRNTYDDIIKAQYQLDLSSMALRDDCYSGTLLKNWGIPLADYKFHTLVLLGNRLFTSPNGFRHSIRYLHELDMLFDTGIINSSFGKWRYWENEEFTENDFLRYISDSDPMLNDFLDAMDLYKITITCGDHHIERESYSLNILKHWELDDNNLFAMNTDEQMVMREDFKRKHEETLEKAREIIDLIH